MKLPDKAKEISEQIKYATLATVTEQGEPWNTPVFAVMDKDGNVYWGSYIKSQHSKNIARNGKVFIVIYNSTTPAGTGLGIYIKATAKALKDEAEIKFAYELLQFRRIVPYWDFEALKNGQPVCIYKASPLKAWINSEGRADGYYIDTRTDIEL